ARARLLFGVAGAGAAGGGARLRAQGGRDPPRHQALEHHGPARRPAEADGLRRGPAGELHRHAVGTRAGLALLHGARADPGRGADAATFVAALMGADAGTGMPGISPDPLLKSLVSSMSPSAASAAAGGAHRATPAPRTMAATGPAASPTTTLNTSMLRLRAAARERWPLGLAAGLTVAAALTVSSWATRPPAPEAGPSGPLRIETQPPG